MTTTETSVVLGVPSTTMKPKNSMRFDGEVPRYISKFVSRCDLRWKLKLVPGELPATAKKHITAVLPKGKSLQDVFADFIRYLYDSTKAFIHESEPMGKELWEKVESNIDLILSHPNGWEGREQEFLRKSVVQASVFNEEESLSRVSFVTEGEATFNYCVLNTQSTESLEVLSFGVSSHRAF